MTEDRTQRGVFAGARQECERRLDNGESFQAVEPYIDGLPVAPDDRAALWLWAWARSDLLANRRPRRWRVPVPSR